MRSNRPVRRTNRETTTAFVKGGSVGSHLIDLVGRREIADRAGTTPGLVDAWRRRHPDFPAPEWVVSGTPVWRWEVVAAWLAKPRPTGRPKPVANPAADSPGTATHDPEHD